MSNTKVVIPARLSYCNLFEAKAINDSDPKYSVSLIIPKSDTKTIAKIKEAIKAAAEAGAASKFGGKVPANLQPTLRDGDIDREDDPAYENCYFLNANSKQAPQVVDRALNKIIDQTEVYSGCYGNVSVNFYAFNKNGNKGVAAGLGNVQKVRDGEPLGGRTRAEDDFEALEADENFLD